MKKVYVLYSNNQIGYGCYENKSVAEEIARIMSEQMKKEWKVKELTIFPKPY